MNFYSTHFVKPDIILEISEHYIKENGEFLWISKLNYMSGEIIDLASIVAYDPENDAEGLFDWDDLYFYVMFYCSGKKHIVEIIDLNKKEKITSKERVEEIFNEYKQKTEKSRN